MRQSEILDLMGKADKHYNFVRIVVFDSNADELVSDGTPLFEALIKDICPAVESIKMIRDETIDGNLDFSSPFGEKIRQRLQSLKDDAMLMADKLGDVQKRVLYTDKDLFDSVHCLLMNLFAILNNISDIWKYVTPGTQGAQGGEASTPPPLRPDEINEVRIKSLFLPYRHKSAEAFIKHLQAAMAEQYYTPDFKKYEKISLAIIMVKTYLNAVTASKAARAQILIPKAQKSWDYFQKEVFESLGETSPRYRKDIIKDKS